MWYCVNGQVATNILNTIWSFETRTTCPEIQSSIPQDLNLQFNQLAWRTCCIIYNIYYLSSRPWMNKWLTVTLYFRKPWSVKLQTSPHLCESQNILFFVECHLSLFMNTCQNLCYSVSGVDKWMWMWSTDGMMSGRIWSTQRKTRHSAPLSATNPTPTSWNKN